VGREKLAGPTEREPVIAWGKQMALDLTYSIAASPSPPAGEGGHAHDEQLRLILTIAQKFDPVRRD
jgi:hypothetical protein